MLKTTKYVMSVANCSRSTVDRARKAGELRFVKIRSAVRYHSADVQAWIAPK